MSNIREILSVTPLCSSGGSDPQCRAWDREPNPGRINFQAYFISAALQARAEMMQFLIWWRGALFLMIHYSVHGLPLCLCCWVSDQLSSWKSSAIVHCKNRWDF